MNLSSLKWVSWLLLVVPLVAQAGTPAEYQALNNWCIAINNKEHGRPIGRWTPQPPDSSFYNHYCTALEILGKLYGTHSKEQVRYILQSFEDNIGYVISHERPDNYLLPEVYALHAKGLYLTKQYITAERSLTKVLELDPHYAAAYVTLADIYLDTKRKPEAEKAVRKGLALDAESKGLKRLAKRLGIALPPSSAPPEVAAPAPVTPPAKVEKPEAKAEGALLTPTLAPSEIGSPTNPYCRFCTDIRAAPAAASPSTPGVIPKAGK